MVAHQTANLDVNKYDADGLRIYSAVGGQNGETKYVWDVNRGLPTVLVEYVPGETIFTITGLGLIARVVVNAEGENYLYYHHDGLGSTRAITNAQSVTIRGYDYDAFGTATTAWAAPGTTLGNAYTFAGEPYDAQTGTYYLRARHYDPATGRFTQPDPIGFAGGGNLYAYAGNNPATYSDPTGLACLPCVVGAAAIVWAGVEFALAAYDAYDTGRVLLDPQASAEEKAFAAAFFAAGTVAPGGGYGAAARATRHRFLSVAYEVDIDDIRHASRGRHKTRANAVLQGDLRSDAAFRARMEELIPDIYGAAASRGNPQEWRWHHAIRDGRMYLQLVPATQHDRGPLLKRIHRGGKGGYARRNEP
jgi:RHS repeat-associated protein